MTLLLERKILALTTQAETMATLLDLDCRAELFEEPINQAVFNFAVKYWEREGKRLAPTQEVLEHEFPGVAFESDFEESPTWLVGAIQKRFLINRLQNLLRSAAVESSSDPIWALEFLRENSAQILETGGQKKEQYSWSPIDLTDVVADVVRGDWEPPSPNMFRRTDGVGLLYAGMSHSFHGEPGSAKSLYVQSECVIQINECSHVLFLDFDSDMRSVTARLLEMGAKPEAIADYFHYLRPETTLHSAGEHSAWRATLSAHPYTLVVIDNVTEAFTVFGYSSQDNDDIAKWVNDFPKKICHATGAAVAMIDHVTKDASSRGRYAIGGQAKLAGLTGASYAVEVYESPGRGKCGEIVLRMGKDRPGGLTQHCGPMRKDRSQEAARIIIDATGQQTIVTVNPPRVASATAGGEDEPFRPTRLMERASRVIEEHPGQLTKSQVAQLVTGRRLYVLGAIDLLAENNEYVTAVQDGRFFRYTSVKPFRQDDLADRLRRGQVSNE